MLVPGKRAWRGKPMSLICEGSQRERPRAGDVISYTVRWQKEYSKYVVSIIRYKIPKHLAFRPLYAQGPSNPFCHLTVNKARTRLDKANFNKLRDGYIACMNEDLIAQRGLEPLLKFVNELKDIYPLARSSEAKEKPKKPEDSTEDVTNAITYLQELGVAGFIDFGISVGPRLFPWLFSDHLAYFVVFRPTIRTQTVKSFPCRAPGELVYDQRKSTRMTRSLRSTPPPSVRCLKS